MIPNRRTEDHFMGKLLKAWPLIIALIAVATVFGAIRTTVEVHTAQIKEVEIKVQDNSMRIARLEQIGSMIPEMREDIKTLLREQRRK